MFPINDTIDAVLIGGFLFGVMFTVASLLLGFADVGMDGLHAGDLGGHDVGHDIGHETDGDGVFHSIFNLSALLAFITWFSGVGYLARNGLNLALWIAIILALAFGVAAAWVMTWLLFHVLKINSGEMNRADYEVKGLLARVSGTIRGSGVGEVMFVQQGARHALPARSVTGAPIGRDTEVVILRQERGIAIVQPMAELLDDPAVHPTAPQLSEPAD